MKLSQKSFLLISALLSAQPSAPVVPYYSIRSQSVDAARELAGWTQQVNLFNKESFYSTVALTPEYTHSFRSRNITSCLFDTCEDCPTITVSGSRVADRGPNDWLADYFYLPTDFKSTFRIQPSITNLMLDFNFYFGLDGLANGLFFRVHAPLVQTRWDLDFCETVSVQGTNTHPAGYFTPLAMPASSLLNNFTEYAAGYAPDSLGEVLFQPLQYANITNDSHTRSRLAEIQAVLGWNFLQDEDYHLGAGVRFAAPTGNAPDGTYLFEPVVGNGKHWELGAHLTTHAQLWRSENEAHSLGAYLDANITHLFAAKQMRTFDLKNKPFSRYMLAAQHTYPTENLQGSVDPVGQAMMPIFTVPTSQFNYNYVPLANLTTFQVRVSAAVQVDLAAQITYATHGFTADLGYDFWYRSCEKIQKSCNCPLNPNLDGNTWTLKGDSYAFGFEPNMPLNGATPNNAVPLSFSQSEATINHGTNFNPAGTSTFYEQKNPAIDNARFAYDTTQPVPNPLLRQPNLPASAADQTRTSVQPLYLNESLLDLVGTRGMSHKLYTHFSYRWTEHAKWQPYLGIGTFVEFGVPFSPCSNDCSSVSSSSDSCQTFWPGGSCNSNTRCATCSLSQWGVWVKGGFAFQ